MISTSFPVSSYHSTRASNASAQFKRRSSKDILLRALHSTSSSPFTDCMNLNFPSRRFVYALLSANASSNNPRAQAAPQRYPLLSTLPKRHPCFGRHASVSTSFTLTPSTHPRMFPWTPVSARAFSARRLQGSPITRILGASPPSYCPLHIPSRDLGFPLSPFPSVEP